MDKNSWRILLIDDDGDDYVIVREMLAETRKDRFSVEWASTYANGRKALQEKEYDIVLVDYDLGSDLGTTLIQEFTQSGYSAPMILMTGQGSYALDVQAMHSGAADYLNKRELNPGYLERSIRYTIENKRIQVLLADAKNRLEQANLALEVKNQQLLGLFSHTPAALALYEGQEPFRVIMHNEIYQSTLREPYCVHGVHGLSLPEFEIQENSDAILSALREVASTRRGQTFLDDPYWYPSGKLTWWDWHINPIITGGELAGLVHMAVDVTERHLAQKEKVEYANRMEVQRRLLEQREMERMNIARDLHDGPLQELTAAQFAIREAAGIENRKELAARLETIQQMLLEQAHDIRAFCNDLRPPTLVPFGLEKAIRSHVDSYRERHYDLHVHLDLASDRQTLPEAARMALFRIFQEALNNIVRHSQASEIWVVLNVNADLVELTIRDDGVGFQVPRDWVAQARSGHLGMVGMRERAQAVGGDIEFDSEPGHGSIVRVVVPRKDRGV